MLKDRFHVISQTFSNNFIQDITEANRAKFFKGSRAFGLRDKGEEGVIDGFGIFIVVKNVKIVVREAFIDSIPVLLEK